MYGIEIVAKPEIGKKPSWLEEKSIIPSKIRIKYDWLKKQSTDNIKKSEFKKYLDNPDSEINQYVGENGIIYSYDTKFGV